jgi:very-short-patch-repair endonuclease
VPEKLPLPENVLSRCRELRKSSTNAEKRLWSLLRNRQLAGAKFRRQHPIGDFTVDFYCPDARLVIEIDGGQHSETSHACRDSERTKRLEALGDKVLRFWNFEVLQNPESVMETIFNTLTPTLSQGEREQ